MFKRIKLHNELNAEHLFNRRAAIKLHEIASREFNVLIILDFKNIETVTKSFFWQLMFEFSKKSKTLVYFRNMNESVTKMHKLAKRSMHDKHRKIADVALNIENSTVAHT